MEARTKIVATMGPSINSEHTLRKLILAGVNLFRLNFSHGTHAEHLESIRKIRQLSYYLGKNVGIIQDLSGPKIRLGQLALDKLQLKTGDVVRLFSGTHSKEMDILPVSYPRLAQEVRKGDHILLGDGEIELRVLGIDAGKVVCRVFAGGIITSKKGVNLPSERLSVSALTAKDREDLEVGIRASVDYIALSFVRSGEDIKKLKSLIKKAGADIPVIAKIETTQALKDIDQILIESGAVMVARGDLGVELPLEEIPSLQKKIIRKANALARPVITATQMLKSMVENNRPTRAEVTDVANAIYDGTDAVMLSEETATGSYPVEAVEMMKRIALKAEKDLSNIRVMPSFQTESLKTVPEAISLSAMEMSQELNAKAIVTPTRTGLTARLVSRFRPKAPILALSPNLKTVKRLSLVWAVQACFIPDLEKHHDLLATASERAKKILNLKKGDLIVITAGLSTPGHRKQTPTNTVKLEEVQ